MPEEETIEDYFEGMNDEEFERKLNRTGASKKEL